MGASIPVKITECASPFFISGEDEFIFVFLLPKIQGI